MTLRHFQIFKAVCDSNGITAAAEKLNITQPSVSIIVKELEAFYGIDLFDRIGKKIYLTQAGSLLRQYVEGVLKQCEEAEMILKEQKCFTKCNLGVNVSFAESHLPFLINEIREKIPECDLNIEIRSNERLEKMLTDNQIDIAIYDNLSIESNKTTTFLFEEKMVVVFNKNLWNKSTISAIELSTMPLLLREKGSGVRSCVDNFFLSKGLTSNVIAESSSTLSLLNLCENGLGFAFIPLSLANIECKNRNLEIVNINDNTVNRLYHMAYNDKKYLTQTMKDIISLICESHLYCK